MKRYPKAQVGSIHKSHKGFDFVVEEVNSATDIVVRFLPPFECRVKTTAFAVRSKIVNNPLERTIGGIGFIGQGKYNSGDHKPLFERWYSIFRRVHLEPHKPGNRSYADAVICEEWHNFQNFAAWMESQNLEDSSWHLDKDLLVKGNKVYGPDVCVFLPMEINVFFTRRKSLRGNTPIGVTYHSKSKKYMVQWTKGGKHQYVGSYSTPEAAFYAYKARKEAYAKELAAKWRAKIDPRAYEALMNYTVEITD